MRSRSMSTSSLSDYVPLVGSMTVELEAEVSESGVLKALEDDFERGHFFADEQNAFSSGNEFRHQIRNCLALSCSWWALNN